MGLLDGLAGQILGKLSGGNTDGVTGAAIEMFNQNGGLEGILEKFKASGLGEQAASWVGNGENLTVTPEQISRVLGDGQIAAMAEKFNLTPEVLSNQIAQHLPGVIDKMTPNGEVSAESGGMLSTVLGMLK